MPKYYCLVEFSTLSSEQSVENVTVRFYLSITFRCRLVKQDIGGSQLQLYIKAVEYYNCNWILWKRYIKLLINAKYFFPAAVSTILIADFELNNKLILKYHQQMQLN